MQANKLSTYNTNISTIEKKIEGIKGRPMIKTVAVQKVLTASAAECDRKAQRAASFDFAGLAG